jgi:predicted transcriptional regulator
MSEAAAQMLATLLSSEIKGDLLTLFHRNPGLVDSIDGVARRIGRTGTTIEQDVKSLVSLGVLKLKKIGTIEVLSLNRTRDREILEALANHIKAIKGRAEA